MEEKEQTLLLRWRLERHPLVDFGTIKKYLCPYYAEEGHYTNTPKYHSDSGGKETRNNQTRNGRKWGVCRDLRW